MTAPEEILIGSIRQNLSTEDVDASMVVHRATILFPDMPALELKRVVLKALEVLLRSGEMIAADMTRHDGYLLRNESPDDTIQRIWTLWDERGSPPNPEDMIYLISPQVFEKVRKLHENDPPGSS